MLHVLWHKKFSRLKKNISYKIEIVSHWANYTIEDLQKILEDNLKESERKKGNEITIEVTERI